MKLRSTILIALGVSALLSLSALPVLAGPTPVTALTFGDSHEVGSIFDGVTASDPDRTPLVNHLKGMALNTEESIGGHSYTRSPNDFGFLPVAEFSFSTTGTVLDIGSGGQAYLFAKYDGPADRAWVWYIGNLSGIVTIPNFSPTLNGFSEASLFTPDQYRSDGRIRRPGGDLLGNDLYNADGAGQSVSLKMYAGDYRRAYITIQNDGNQVDSFTVGVDAGGAPGFTIRYFIGRTPTDITGGMEAGNFNTPPLAPGSTYRIRVSATVSTAAPRGSHIDRLVTVTNNFDGVTADTVGFVVRRK